MGTIEIEIEGPPDRVWEALTSQEALRDWFNPTIELAPRQGGRFSFEGTRGEQVYRFEGSVDTLTRSEEIAFSLRSASGDAVTLGFRLRPGADFTIVELHHDGFDGQTGDDGPFWDGDELVPLREHVTGIGPTH